MDNNNNDNIYKSQLDKLIKGHEQFRDSVYQDSDNNPTIGYGTNLNSPEVPEIMRLHDIDYDQVKLGNRKLSEEEANKIKDAQITDKERYFNKMLGERVPASSELNDTKKAALMSMYYNSPKLFGPNMVQHLNNNDDINVIKEMLLRSNKDKKPGVLKRRLDEAEVYGGPQDFANTFKVMDNNEKRELIDILHRTENEQLKQELLKKYMPYLMPQKPVLKKLFEP